MSDNLQPTDTGSAPTLQTYTVSIPTPDGEKVAYEVPIMVPMEWDEIVREWLLTPEAEEMIEETKARHMGLLTPSEIRQLRAKLGLTQAELSELLKIGAKTWTRWETGSQRPSRSLNLVLRSLQVGLLTPGQLRQLGEPQIDWTPAIAATVETKPLSLSLPFVPQEQPGNNEEMPLAA
jgi:putative zinc finger/helix-turn-helix YgiT family protein